MKSATQAVFAAALLSGISLSAAPNFPRFDSNKARRISDREARESVRVEATPGNTSHSLRGAALSALPALPMWLYQVSVAGQYGRTRTYTGRIVGSSPNATQATTVPVVVVPVILNITQGGVTYTFDPTAPDSGCIPDTALNLTEGSPLFQNATFTFDQTGMGSTQFADAFIRGEFWAYTANPSFHLMLNETRGAPLTININAGTQGNLSGAIYSLSGQCGSNTNNVNPPGAIAVINVNAVDSLLQSYISANGLNSSQFPFFVTYNSVLSQGNASNLDNCCILGYHTSLSSGQTYGLAEFEGRNQTIFSGVSDISAASHEINEWVNDPLGSNATPPWGDLGQESGCQADLEVADPLSGTLMPVVTLNGFPYHLQELAYFGWFFGVSGLGTPGDYSSNGTFKGPARACPPGGTN